LQKVYSLLLKIRKIYLFHSINEPGSLPFCPLASFIPAVFPEIVTQNKFKT